MEAIAWKYLRQVQKRLERMDIQLQLPEELAHELSRRCGKKAGARQLRKLVQEEVEGPLATLLLGKAKRPGRIRGVYKEGALEFL